MAVSESLLRQNQAYQTTEAIAEILSDLEIIKDIDARAEVESQRLRRQAVQKRGLGGLCLFVSVFGIPFLLSVVAALAWSTVLLVTVPFFGLGVFLRIQGRKAHNAWIQIRRLDVPNHRYQFVQRLVPILRQDMKTSGKLSIDLDFSPPDGQRKHVTQQPHPRRRGWTIEFYDDPWLTLAGRLVDGTRFVLAVSQRHQIRSGRNVNGKLRTRPRFKGFDLRLDVSCPAALRSHLATLPNPKGAVQLKRHAYLKQIKVTDKGLTLKVRLSEAPFPAFVPASVRPELTYRHPSVLSPLAISAASQQVEQALLETSLAMFLSGFQVINLARLQAKDTA